jgi:hypothetical protein
MIARAIKKAGLAERHFLPRRNWNELALVRRPRIEVERLVAHGDAHTARQSVPIIVDHLLPRAAIDHRLVALDTGPFLAFIGGYGGGAELNSFDRLVGFRAQFLDLDAVKLGFFESAQESLLLKSAGNAGAPKIPVLRQMLRHRLIANNVGDDNSAAASKHTIHLAEQYFFVF